MVDGDANGAGGVIVGIGVGFISNGVLLSIYFSIFKNGSGSMDHEPS